MSKLTTWGEACIAERLPIQLSGKPLFTLDSFRKRPVREIEEV
jgi:hypothetical protein